MKKRVLIIAVISLLVIIIGLGVWVIISRQFQSSSDTQTAQPTNSWTADEVALHSSKSDCWTIISGDVYDLTTFINRHPGGDEILRACGTDATTLFTSRQTDDGQFVGSGTPHSQTAYEQLAKLKIGSLK
ncbi:MAG TPA: cytochrome b5-like heme/steroid binding domain-containing protein [Candidatus Saccharimonadaceae bacterium]|nr:cytochrome b5-like heme/steroid binding domain-containing protein [Candidatus Saccharimonadaceae bacterium]